MVIGWLIGYDGFIVLPKSIIKGAFVGSINPAATQNKANSQVIAWLKHS